MKKISELTRFWSLMSILLHFHWDIIRSLSCLLNTARSRRADTAIPLHFELFETESTTLAWFYYDRTSFSMSRTATFTLLGLQYASCIHCISRYQAFFNRSFALEIPHCHKFSGSSCQCGTCYWFSRSSAFYPFFQIFEPHLPRSRHQLKLLQWISSRIRICLTFSKPCASDYFVICLYIFIYGRVLGWVLIMKSSILLIWS